MEISANYQDYKPEIIELLQETFTKSEGAEEGALIAKLAQDFLQTTDPKDLFVFTSWQDGKITGCIIFSRLRFAQDRRVAFLLGPVAVATPHQRQGIGQALLTAGLEALREHGVQVAVTYGDPDYYVKTGFHPVRQDDVAPPRALTYPHGWLAQSLDGQSLTPLKGPSTCVAAIDDPAYW